MTFEANRKMPLDTPRLLEGALRSAGVVSPLEEQSLAALALEIKELLREAQDARLRLALALAQAKGLIDRRIGTNLNWQQWCAANVVKPSGEPYTQRYLNGLVRIGQSVRPEKVLALKRAAEVRADSRSRLGRTSGRIIGPLRANAARALADDDIEKLKTLRAQGKTHREMALLTGLHPRRIRAHLYENRKSRQQLLAQAKDASITGEVEALMTVWERASAEARRQFLHAINARLIA